MLLSLLWLITDALGWWGSILIAYSIGAAYSQPWPPLEKWAPFISSLLTVLGTLLTTTTIFMPVRLPRAPWKYSRYTVGPVIIAACCIAAGILLKRKELPAVAVSGFALLAISGGLKRLIPAKVFLELVGPDDAPDAKAHTAAK